MGDEKSARPTNIAIVMCVTSQSLAACASEISEIIVLATGTSRSLEIGSIFAARAGAASHSVYNTRIPRSPWCKYGSYQGMPSGMPEVLRHECAFRR